MKVWVLQFSTEDEVEDVTEIFSCFPSYEGLNKILMEIYLGEAITIDQYNEVVKNKICKYGLVSYLSISEWEVINV